MQVKWPVPNYSRLITGPISLYLCVGMNQVQKYRLSYDTRISFSIVFLGQICVTRKINQPYAGLLFHYNKLRIMMKDGVVIFTYGMGKLNTILLHIIASQKIYLKMSVVHLNHFTHYGPATPVGMLTNVKVIAWLRTNDNYLSIGS